MDGEQYIRRLKGRKKGIALPTSALVLIVIAVLVLVAVATFFIWAGGVAAGRAELEKTFHQTCLAICANPERMQLNLAAQFPEWQRACEQLHGVERGAYLQCLDLCSPGCLLPPRPCEYLCGFEPVVDDWPDFCRRVQTHPATAATYGACDCACPKE